ncbi:MAG: T9SS type A sorting domain-containing protein [Bacteroidota bacterium]
MLTAMCINTFAQTPVWTYTYGNGQYAYGKGIIEDADGSFFVLANEGSSSNTKINIIKIDSLGEILWKKVIGSEAVYQSEDFKRTPDKGLIITGYTDKNFTSSYDVLVIKTDSNANVEWEKTYGGSDWDMAHAVLALPDTTYVVAGETYSYGSGSSDIYILKLDAVGDTLWTMVYGGDSSDYATCLDTTSDGNYYVGANTKSFGAGGFDGLIMKMNPFGDTVWTAVYGDSLEDLIYSVKTLPDSGYIFGGSTQDTGINKQKWAMRFHSNGSFMWSIPQSWTICPQEEVICSITVDDSARYVFVGTTTCYGYGRKEACYSLMGDYAAFYCSYTLGSVWDDGLAYAIQTHDSGYIAIGSTEGMGPGLSNILIAKTDKDCTIVGTAVHIAGTTEISDESTKIFSILANISTGLFQVMINSTHALENADITVYDILGNIVYSKQIPSAGSQLELNLTNCTDGMYLVRLTDSSISFAEKIFICR